MIGLARLGHHIQHAWVYYLLVVLGITVFALYSVTGLKINNDFEDWFRKDDVGKIKYHKFEDLFGSDDYLVVAIDHGEVFNKDTIDSIENLTKAFEKLDGVDKVTSIYNIDEIRGEDDTVIVGSMFDNERVATTDYKGIRQRALSNKLYQGNVVDSEGMISAIWIRSMPDPGRVNHARKLTDSVYEILRKNLRVDQKYYVAGTVAVIAAEDKASTEEALLTYVLLSTILIFLLYFYFRNLILVFAPLLVVSLAVIWVFALYPLLGSDYNLLSSVVSSLVLMIGIANAVHYITDYQTQYGLTNDARKASVRAFSSVAKACFFATVTTAAGFFSMEVSKFLPISEFGFYSGIAILITFVISMLLLPIATSKLNVRPNINTVESSRQKFERLFRGISRFNKNRPWTVLGITLVILVISIFGITRIQVNTNFTKFFLEDHHYRQSVNYIDDHLSGSLSLEVLLEGEDGILKSPRILQKIEQLQHKVEQYDVVTKTISPVDYLKELNKALHRNDAQYFSVPETSSEVVQFAFFGDEVLSEFLDLMSYGYARIHIRLHDLDSNEMRRISDLIKTDIHQILGGEPLEISVTGTMELYSKAADYIVDSQVYGFALALALIFLLVSFFVRSVPLALIVMVPNVIPIILTFGLMGWFGINLDFGTVVVASVALGLAVDDTIHFISRFRDYYDQYKDYDVAIEKSLVKVGPPMLITTVVLFFGFSSVLISSYKPLIFFGILAALTVSSALIADIFVLPCLLKLLKPLRSSTLSHGAVPVADEINTNKTSVLPD